MSARRWTLALLAVLAAAAGLFYVTHEPAAPAPPTPHEARLPKPPVDAPRTPASASASPAIATSAAPPSMPSPNVSPAAAVLRIGSEGYGPHIERAHAGTDAASAWEAVQWLRHCAANETRRQSFEQARNRGIAPEMMTQMMVEADADARRCQTVTDEHRALLPELAARAGRAGVPDATSAYVNSLFAQELSAAQRRDVAERMRRDARAGLGASLLNAALSDPAWGLSDEEKFAFLLAYATQRDQPGAVVVLKLLRERGYLQPGSPLTREQMAAARELGFQALEQAPARSR